MMYRREGFDDKQLRYAHAAGFRNPANIVTHQIHNHQILRPVFRGGGEFSAC
jgi:hypothetical protein